MSYAEQEDVITFCEILHLKYVGEVKDMKE